MIESIQVIQSDPSVTQLATLDATKKKTAHKLANELLVITATLEEKASRKKEANKQTVTPIAVSQTQSSSGNSGYAQSGLYGALSAIIELILVIQSLQSTNTNLLEKLSSIVADQSTAENAALAQIAARMPGDSKEARADDNALFQTTMTKYNNLIQTSQTQVQNFMTLTSDQSKAISGDAQNSQAIIGTMIDIAGLLR